MDSNTVIVIAIVLAAVVLVTVLNPRLRSIAIRLPGKLRMDVKNNPQETKPGAVQTESSSGVDVEKSKLKKSALRLVPEGRLRISKSKLEESPISIGKASDLGAKSDEP